MICNFRTFETYIQHLIERSVLLPDDNYYYVLRPGYLSNFQHRNEIKLSDIEQYFEEFKLEIDEEAQKIIDKKDNDVIQIEPLYFNTNGSITYSIECIHYDDNNNIRRIETSVDTSQAEGIIRCYQKMRLRTWQTQNWKEIIHRHVKCFVYGKK